MDPHVPFISMRQIDSLQELLLFIERLQLQLHIAAWSRALTSQADDCTPSSFAIDRNSLSRLYQSTAVTLL
jgi:hypothetical protein